MHEKNKAMREFCWDKKKIKKGWQGWRRQHHHRCQSKNHLLRYTITPPTSNNSNKSSERWDAYCIDDAFVHFIMIRSASWSMVATILSSSSSLPSFHSWKQANRQGILRRNTSLISTHSRRTSQKEFDDNDDDQADSRWTSGCGHLGKKLQSAHSSFFFTLPTHSRITKVFCHVIVKIVITLVKLWWKNAPVPKNDTRTNYDYETS